MSLDAVNAQKTTILDVMSIADGIIIDTVNYYYTIMNRFMRLVFIAYICIPLLAYMFVMMLCVFAAGNVNIDLIQFIAIVSFVMVAGSILCILSGSCYVKIYECKLAVELQLIQYRHTYISVVRPSGLVCLADMFLTSGIQKVDTMLAQISTTVGVNRLLWFYSRYISRELDTMCVTN